MSELTDEDREVARIINDQQRLMHADMLAAFPDGILKFHLGAWAGSFMQMFLLMAPAEERRKIWDTVVTGIERRFKDGRL